MRTPFRRVRLLVGSSRPLNARDGGGTAADRARTERVLAAARIFFAGSLLLAVGVDPAQAARNSLSTYLFLSGYLITAVLIWLALRHRSALGTGFQVWTEAGDLIWAALLTAMTEGPNSPFFLFFMFALLAAASRWGFRETVSTACLAVVLLAVEAVAIQGGEGTDVDRLMVRSAYLLIVGGLLGYLAEEEKQRRSEAAAITRIASNIRAEANIWTTFEAIAGEVVALCGAERIVLLFEEVQSGRTFLWSADRKPDGAVRIAASEVATSDAGQYRFEPPGDAWRATRRADGAQPPSWEILALDREGRRIDPRPLALPDAWIGGQPPSSVIGVGVSFADIGSGIMLLFNAPLGALPQVRFLQRLAHQLAPAVYSVYLLRRLRTRVGALERARIAHELHDGIIQSLIGLEMQLDALRRSPGDAAQVVSELGHIQQLLAREIRDVRDLMHQLEPIDVAPRHLLEQLEELVGRFQRETGITARFVSEVEEVTLAPHVCHELTRITQEALVNVRKHSGARNVVVRFTSEAGAPTLIIDNDGRSLDFTGRLSHADLDQRRKGPVVIKERVRAIGGTLTIESSDRGVRLEITLPPRGIVRHRTA